MGGRRSTPRAGQHLRSANVASITDTGAMSRSRKKREPDETVGFSPAGHVRGLSDFADGVTSGHVSKAGRRIGTALVLLILALTVGAALVGLLSRN